MEILQNDKNISIIDTTTETDKQHELKQIVLYSYNSLIALYTKNYLTNEAILFLTDKYNYSQTTKKHLNNFIKNYTFTNFDLKNIKELTNNNNFNIDKKFIYYIKEV